MLTLIAPLLALAQPAPSLATPTPAQAAWHDLEVGMFVHIAPQTWQDSEWDTQKTALADINPDQLDTEQWANVATSMGAKYVVFVAKHEGGFCWWPTETTEYSVRSIPWRNGQGDVLADLAASCRSHNLGLGVYLSPQDKHHGVGVGGRSKDPAEQAAYERVFRAQLTELLTRYGDIMEVWFDGSLVFDVGDILAAHAPKAVVFQGPQASIRWVGNEDGHAPYPAWNAVKSGTKPWGQYTAADGDPEGDRWLPNECDARIRATWFWRTDNAGTLKSVESLMDMYERSVGHGGVLLLNHTPDRTGLIPGADAGRAAEFGAAVRKRYGSPVASTSGRGAELRATFSAPATIDRVVSMEDISLGERVRAYRIEALVDGEWKPLAKGTAIGHKRIDRVPPTLAEGVRLVITASAGEPVVRSLAAYAAIPEPTP